MIAPHLIYHRIKFTLLLAMIVPLSALGQITFTGTVIDDVTEEPVPFANIYFKGSQSGASTNFEGEFSLTVSSKPDSIIASTLGYKPLSKPVTAAAQQHFSFRLEKESFAIEEVEVVAGEYPEVWLHRKIIENKPRNTNSNLESYSYEAYNKVELDLYNYDEKFKDRKIMKPFQFIFDYVDTTTEEVDFLPIFISESLSDYYYRSSPRAEREIIKASKISGMKNESISQFLGSMYQEVDVYKNWISLFGKSFISPVANSAMGYYNFRIVDSSYIDGTWCRRLDFSPKGKGTNSFIGYMWVADCSFAVKSISLQAASYINVNFIDKVSIHQDFDVSVFNGAAQDSVWLLEKDKIVIKFKLTEGVIGFIGKKTTTFDDLKITIPEIDSLLDVREDISVKEDLFDKSDEYWQENRHEELSAQEENIYGMVDSLKNTKAFRTWVDIANLVITGYYEIGKFEIGPILSAIGFDEVEKVRLKLGLRTSSKMSERFRIGGYAAYGTKDVTFKGGGDVLIKITNRPRSFIGGSYVYDLDLRKTGVGDLSQDNLLTGLIRRKQVPQKLNMLQGWEAYYEKNWTAGVRNKLTFRSYQVTPKFDYSYLSGIDDTYEDSIISRFNYSELEFFTRFAYKEKFIDGPFEQVSLGTKFPTLIFKYTLGLRNVLNSGFNYHRVDLVLSDDVLVNPIGRFYYDIHMGKILGDLPTQLLEIPQGNETYFFNTYAFNLMNEYEFAADMFVAVILRHHFEGFFLGKIPGIRKLKWRTLIMAKAFMGTMTDANRNANQRNNFIIPDTKPYIEVGVGIENIFKIFRVDFIYRATYRNDPTNTKALNWGIRAGMELSL